MSLLAESLVEEFLNRMGFFTVRGLKRGVHEIDLLGLKYEEGKPRGIHVEAQISFRPVSYITKLPKKYARETSASSRTTVKKRSPDLMKLCVEDWVNLKFHDVKKVNLRNKMIQNFKWDYFFVHGEVKDEGELEYISSLGIRLIPFYQVLGYLCDGGDTSKFRFGARTDISEMIDYFESRFILDKDRNIFLDLLVLEKKNSI